jgi:hypothetical protein
MREYGPVSFRELFPGQFIARSLRVDLVAAGGCVLKKPIFRVIPAKTFIIFKDYIDALPHITGCTRLQQSLRK